MTRLTRLLLIMAGAVGVFWTGIRLLESLGIISNNRLTDGRPVGLRDHYLQVGRFYAEGFTTGFFFCFFLMLVAVAIGTWVDEARRARRAAAAAKLSAPLGAPSASPAADA